MSTATFLENYLKVTTEDAKPTAEETATKNKAVYEKIGDIRKKIAELTEELSKQLKLLEEPGVVNADFNIAEIREKCKTQVDAYALANTSFTKHPHGKYGVYRSEIMGGLAVEAGNKKMVISCCEYYGSAQIFMVNMMKVAIFKQKKEMFSWLVDQASYSWWHQNSIQELFDIQDDLVSKDKQKFKMDSALWLYIPLMVKYPEMQPMIIKQIVAKCYLTKTPADCADMTVDMLYAVSAEAAKQQCKHVLDWASFMISDREKKKADTKNTVTVSDCGCSDE